MSNTVVQEDVWTDDLRNSVVRAADEGASVILDELEGLAGSGVSRGSVIDLGRVERRAVDVLNHPYMSRDGEKWPRKSVHGSE